MNCRTFERDLADWMSGRVSDEHAGNMAGHIAACVTCEKLAALERESRSSWDALRTQAYAPDLWPRLVQRLAVPTPKRSIWPTRSWIAGGAFAAVIPIAIIFTMHIHTSTTKTPDVTGILSASGSRTTEALSPNQNAQANPLNLVQEVKLSDPAVDDPVGSNMENVWLHVAPQIKRQSSD